MRKKDDLAFREKQVENLREALDEANEKLAAYEAELNAFIAPHVPRFEKKGEPAWELRLGNSGVIREFWCDKCRTQWPCQTVNDIHAIYGRVTGWKASLVPYAPLSLHKEEVKPDGD